MTRWVAIVDDDMTNLRVAGQILSKHNIRVSAMKSGAALINFVKENRPSLILLDIAMPGLNGFETLERLRAFEKAENLREIPVIFLTADENLDTESKGFEMGVADFIRKPFYPEVLLKRIDHVLMQQEQMNRLEEEASFDGLTGFLNKAASVERAIAFCKTKSGCFMMVDLDSFKLVNDIYGHDMGDKVLIAFADQIKGSLDFEGLFGRVGGDEFIVFAVGMNDDSELKAFTEKLNRGLMAEAKKLMGDDMAIPLGASVGAVYVPEKGTDYEDISRMADKCLYSVKQNGKHGCLSLRELDRRADNMSDLEIKKYTLLFNERNVPDSAMLLEKEEFIHVYRFLLRFQKRFDMCISKVLITLSREEGLADSKYSILCGDFGNLLRQSLRKSDIMLKVRQNQYLLLLTDTRDIYVENILSRIITVWNGGNTRQYLSVSYEMETLYPDDTLKSNVSG